MKGNGSILGTPRVGVRVVDIVNDSDRAWKEDAACRNAPDVDVWFPAPGESHHAAKAVCRDCPVRKECLDYSLRHNERHGIWGGLNERERRLIRRQRGVAVGGQESPFTSTQRQRIVFLDARGWSDSEIAAEFGCTPRTVQRVLARERLS